MNFSKAAIYLCFSKHSTFFKLTFIKDKFNKVFSKCIKTSRANLADLHRRITELAEIKSNLSKALENNAITPEDFVKFLKQNQEMEDVLVNVEIRMYRWLTQLLERKHEIR